MVHYMYVKITKGDKMTRTEIYTSSRDRDVIVEEAWQNGKMRYIRLGSVFYRDDLTKIDMLNEKDTDQWKLKGQITRSEKLILCRKIVKQLVKQLRRVY